MLLRCMNEVGETDNAAIKTEQRTAAAAGSHRLV